MQFNFGISVRWEKPLWWLYHQKLQAVIYVSDLSDLCKKIQQAKEYWFSSKIHKMNIMSCEDLSFKISFILWMWVENNNSFASAGFNILFIDGI